MPKAKEGKPKSIILKDIPDSAWEKICAIKRHLMEKNKLRGSVSHREAIIKLIQNNCQ